MTCCGILMTRTPSESPVRRACAQLVLDRPSPAAIPAGPIHDHTSSAVLPFFLRFLMASMACRPLGGLAHQTMPPSSPAMKMPGCWFRNWVVTNGYRPASPTEHQLDRLHRQDAKQAPVTDAGEGFTAGLPVDDAERALRTGRTQEDEPMQRSGSMPVQVTGSLRPLFAGCLERLLVSPEVFSGARKWR